MSISTTTTTVSIYYFAPSGMTYFCRMRPFHLFRDGSVLEKQDRGDHLDTELLGEIRELLGVNLVEVDVELFSREVVEDGVHLAAGLAGLVERGHEEHDRQSGRLESVHGWDLLHA